MTSRPVDRLILELIETVREATPVEVRDIVEHMAKAPFDTNPVRIPQADRGIAYRGYVLGARADAWTYHLVKRVVIERQWAFDTTADQYLADLRAAIRHEAARVAVFRRRGGHLAATVTYTEQVVPSERLGERAEANL